MVSKWMLVLVLLGSSAAVLAQGQEAVPPSPLLTSTGTATIVVPPTSVEFVLRYESKGATIEESMTAAQKFRENMTAALAGKEWKASDSFYAPPAVSTLKEKTARTFARLVFPMTAYSNPETGPKDFGRCCDFLSGIAQGLGATLEEPTFRVNDEDVTEQAAVSAATENAYSLAPAVAEALHGSISAVDSVEILSTEWNNKPDAKPEKANLREIACTAKVKVSYIVTLRP